MHKETSYLHKKDIIEAYSTALYIVLSANYKTEENIMHKVNKYLKDVYDKGITDIKQISKNIFKKISKKYSNDIFKRGLYTNKRILSIENTSVNQMTDILVVELQKIVNNPNNFINIQEGGSKLGAESAISSAVSAISTIPKIDKEIIIEQPIKLKNLSGISAISSAVSAISTIPKIDKEIIIEQPIKLKNLSGISAAISASVSAIPIKINKIKYAQIKNMSRIINNFRETLIIFYENDIAILNRTYNIPLYNIPLEDTIKDILKISIKNVIGNILKRHLEFHRTDLIDKNTEFVKYGVNVMKDFISNKDDEYLLSEIGLKDINRTIYKILSDIFKYKDDRDISSGTGSMKRSVYSGIGSMGRSVSSGIGSMGRSVSSGINRLRRLIYQPLPVPPKVRNIPYSIPSVLSAVSVVASNVGKKPVEPIKLDRKIPNTYYYKPEQLKHIKNIELDKDYIPKITKELNGYIVNKKLNKDNRDYYIIHRYLRELVKEKLAIKRVRLRLFLLGVFQHIFLIQTQATWSSYERP